MKKIFFIIFLLFFAQSSFALVLDSTTGFVSGNIWYSQAKLTEGDSVKIYTGFWNGENSPVSIKVSFFDKDTLLGTREVEIPALTLKDISIPWSVTSGDHQISARILKATSNQSGTNEDISLVNDEVKNSSMFIPKKIGSEVGAEKLGELGEKVIGVLPDDVSEPISSSVVEIDLFRQKTSTQIDNGIKEAKEKIKQIDLNTNSTGDSSKTEVKSGKDSLDGTEKPIAYLQLYLLTVASFIFSHSFLFYGLIIVLIFFVIRLIYRKIRGR